MIYRGQLYGEPVGEWWTQSEKEAEQFAIHRGKSWIVLALDEDDEEWLAQFRYDYEHKFDGKLCEQYRIPVVPSTDVDRGQTILSRWSGVKIIKGNIEIK